MTLRRDLGPDPRRGLVRWAIGGVASGLAGTAVMTATLALEKKVRSEDVELIDYDASDHVVTATAHVLGVHPKPGAQSTALFLLTHWGYGSAVAIAHEALRTRAPERVSAPMFYATCQTMAFVLFPTIGDTPPPWKWRPDVIATSLGQHAIYAATVAATSSWLRSRRHRL